MPGIEGLILLVSFTVTGLGLLSLLQPARAEAFLALLAVIVVLGTESLLRAHRGFLPLPWPHRLTYDILPALLTIGGGLFVLPLREEEWIVGGVLGLGFLLLLGILGLYHTLDARDRTFGPATLAVNLTTYLTAFGFFVLIYATKTRSLQSATAIAIVSFLIALVLFRAETRGWIYAGTTGLVMGETAWGLNYWPVTGLSGGIFLLLVFYVATGLLQNYLRGRVTRGVVIEFGALAVIGFLLLFTSPFWVH